MKLAPGQIVSHYRIIEVLGEGGMGIVYRAQDLKLPREVALKFLHDDVTRDAQAMKRFVTEAETASSLHHPNICTIHDVDKTEDGRAFIVMPCYQGETLRSRLEREGALPTATALRLASQLADGLARAHSKSIIHRDVKPENIFIANDGTAVLMDFGLAKLSGTTRVTRTGRTVGTIAYMSPEQATGAEIDHRSDNFSLGVVLYEMLTGVRPFTGDHEAAVIYSIVHLDPQPMAIHRPNLSPAFQTLIDRALKKKPEERFASAAEFRSKLLELSSGPHVASRHTRGGRRGWITLSVAIAGLIAVAALTRGWWMRDHASDPKDQALAIVGFHNIADAKDEVTTAGITELVNVGLIESSPIRLISIEYLQDMQRRLFGSSSGAIRNDQALEIARKAGATFLLAGSIGMRNGQPFVTWRLVEAKSGLNLAARTVEGADLAGVADQVVAGTLPVLERRLGVIDTTPPRSVAEMTTKNPEAYRHYVAGLQANHQAQQKIALREFQAAVSRDSTFALAYFELSRAAHQVDDAVVHEALGHAWAHRSALGIKDRMRLEAWKESFSGSQRATIDAYRELAARWPDDRDVLSDLSTILFFQGYFDESIETVKRATALFPDDNDLLFQEAYSLAWSGEYEAALRINRRLTVREPTNPNFWDEVGQRYLALGLPDSAEVAFNKALAIDAKFTFSLRGLAEAAYCRGNVDEAIGRLGTLLRTPELPPDTRNDVDSGNRVSMAFLYAESGQFTEALVVNKRAMIDSASRKNLGQAFTAAHVRQSLFLLIDDRNGAITINHQARQYAREPESYVSFNVDLFLGIDSLAAAQREFEHHYFPNRHRWGAAGYQFFQYRKARLLLRENQPDSALTYLASLRSGWFDNALSRWGIEYRHELAHALQAAGRPEEAVAVLRDLVRVCGGHALGHYELGKLYEDMKRKDDARKEYTKFLDMWSHADEGLPQLIDARKRLAALKT